MLLLPVLVLSFPLDLIALTIPQGPVQHEPREVRIEVVYDWNKDRIKQEIRDMFPEDPETAVAIGICESQLKMVRAQAILDYGREESYGVMQVHARVHHQTALDYGLTEYKTDIKQNIQMARIVSDGAVSNGLHMYQPWTCYTSGEYKKYL